ncbi:hypothetical protein HanPI659440_Chr02g0043621 [Helianthus annuus]|nr:hypothetical protein HanPI659440_Chr02g0043621 [Helianthus annuus]
MSEFFNVRIELLSNYEYQEKQFKEEVAHLRLKFIQSTAPGGLNDDRRGVIPASGFSDNAQNIWKQIKENKDLDLPSQMIMVSTIRCEKILEDIYSSFVVNYKVVYFDAEVVSAKRKQLEEKVMEHVLPAYKQLFKHIRSESLDYFTRALKDALNEGQGFAEAARNCTKKSVGRFNELCEDATIKQANWDPTKIRDKFYHDLDQHITKVRAARLDELTTLYEVN